MKKYEYEALLKSFLLFFLLLSAIYLLFALGNYRDRQRVLDEKILDEMRIFSFHPTGRRFEVDFVPMNGRLRTLHLYKSDRELYAYFSIPGSKRYMMKITLPHHRYEARLEKIRNESFSVWWLYLILIGAVSFLLAFYTIHPLKRALELNEEFVKDILHDINTPLSALRINLNLLKKRYGDERTIHRMFASLETIQAFQSNLKAFLDRECGIGERFELREMLAKRIEYFRQVYPGIDYRMEMKDPLWLHCNREAMLRILENLLSNAGRYNRPGGIVTIRMMGTRLVIEDTGIGIREPERVFERFYREGERGLGLGLHIVRKLTDALGIDVRLESQVGTGTRFELELSRVIAG